MKLFHWLRIVSYFSALTAGVVALSGDDATATFSMAGAIWLWLLGNEERRSAA